MKGGEGMMIVERDIELMKWISEQKFMTTRQIKKVFWKGALERTTEVCRRLCELAEAGYLKRSARSFYREVLYMVTAKGVRILRDHGKNGGLSELTDVDHSQYKHDVFVTDLRILFKELGYPEWISERVLSKWYELRRIPDGMIHHNGQHFAVEYESAQKSKDRYRNIFIDYHMDQAIDQTIYIVDAPALHAKVSGYGATFAKVFFVTLQDLEEQKLRAKLKGADLTTTLGDLLDAKV